MADQLNLENLKSTWPNREEIFRKEKAKYIKYRFDFIDQLFDQILLQKNQVTTKPDEGKVFIGNDELIGQNNKHLSLDYFGPAKDDIMPRDGDIFQGVKDLSYKFPDYSSLILDIGRLIGGYDKMVDEVFKEFRIVSNGQKDTEKKLNTGGQFHWPNSHFVTNNYFFKVMETIQNIYSDEFNPSNPSIALSHPDQIGDEATQKRYIKTRFPLKFFYMWAKKDKVLHPLSLLGFRQLIKQLDQERRLENSDYEDFVERWPEISKNIFKNVIDKEEPSSQEISELSKLIAIMTLSDADTSNIYELLQIPNHAVILYGPPGTGKTFKAEQVAKKLLTGDENYANDKFESYRFSNPQRDHDGAGFYELVQFHPNYAYEDFMGGIQPNLTDDQTIAYQLQPGIFKRICDEADKLGDKKFIVIIDEINRADLSAIFGELMYALEKRGKPVDIPHFGEFRIPENVYIIGTMNNLDKSLTTFDLALRRRFGFYKMEPDMSVLNDILEDQMDEESLKNYINKCEELNEEIQMQLELSSEYKIGHAYFGKIGDLLSNGVDQPREKLWIYHLKPLLEEYLGSDTEKEQEIVNNLKSLGDKFIYE